MKTDSWLYSDSFPKRALAYWGYYTVASMIIGAAVVAVILIANMALPMGPQTVY